MAFLTIGALRAISTELLAQIENANTRAMYRKAITDFQDWWTYQSGHSFDEILVRGYLVYVNDSGYSSATVNQRLSAIRRLVGKAVERSAIDLSTAAAIIRIAGVPRNSRDRKGRVLSSKQTETLINAPSTSTAKGLRDRALLAILAGCGLSRAELVKLEVQDVRSEPGRWFLINVVGPRGIQRRVMMPDWVKEALDDWTRRANLTEGAVFRSVDRKAVIGKSAITAQTVLAIVREYGCSLGFSVTPDSLRRTCATLCREQGGELEQIQMLLGHASIQSTARLVGHTLTLQEAANARLRMKWYRKSKLAAS
jgi:integrase/recombinase XerD